MIKQKKLVEEKCDKTFRHLNLSYLEYRKNTYNLIEEADDPTEKAAECLYSGML
jgi:hypothetical protein